MGRKNRYSRRGRPSNRFKKGLKIRIVELDEEFDSYSDAARRIGGNRGSVYKCLNDEFGHNTHKGYTFEWVEDYEDYDFW